jgi:hypothetical protein
VKAFKYGITLERLKEEDIELVRQWRNSDAVRLNMEYKKHISAEEQIKWFNSINNISNNYMLIHYKCEKVGVLNDKNIDWENRTSESGIFIGNEKYLHSFLPYFVSVAGIEINFTLFKWRKQYAHILTSNSNARKFNTELGYQLSGDQSGVENQQYELTWESFQNKAGRVRKAVAALAEESHPARILIEPDDYKNPFANKIKSLLENRPDVRSYENSEGIWFEEVRE